MRDTQQYLKVMQLSSTHPVFHIDMWFIERYQLINVS